MIEPNWYFFVVSSIAVALATGMGVHAYRSAIKAGKKIDAIRKEKADLERQLRNLKPHLQ
jgi:hypothetical protein